MVNQLRKFSPRTSELNQPLRELLITKRAWLWGPEQEQAFSRVKEELLQPTTLVQTVHGLQLAHASCIMLQHIDLLPD